MTQAVHPVTETPAGLSRRAFLLRPLAVAGIAVLALALSMAATDPWLKRLVPWFAILLFLQLLPLLWSNRPDSFSPPVYTGLLTGLATVSTLAYFFEQGEVRVVLVDGLSPDAAGDLAFVTLLASAVGVVCYYAGYYHPTWGRAWTALYPRLSGLHWDPGRLRTAAFAVAAAFTLSYAAFQARVGAPLYDVTFLQAGKEVWRDDPALSWMLRGVELGSLPILLYLGCAAPRGAARRVLFWLAALLVVALLGLRLGQRGVFFNAFLPALVILHYLRRRIPAWVLIAGYVAAAALGSVMLPWRTGVVTGKEPESIVDVVRDPAAVLAGHEEERQRFAALALLFYEFPARRDHLLGESWLGAIVIPIPRWIWPDKGEHFVWRDTGIVNKLAGAPIPSSYLGTLYANFSWPGIVFGMALWGLCQRGLYEWLRQDPTEPARVILYAMFLLFFGLTLLQVSAALQYVLPTWAMLRYVMHPGRTAVDVSGRGGSA